MNKLAVNLAKLLEETRGRLV